MRPETVPQLIFLKIQKPDTRAECRDREDTMRIYSVAIDGPAGAGKSTIAKKAAGALRFVYIDTGAMYRAMAIYFLEHGIDKNDEKTISEMCGDIDIEIKYDAGNVQRVFLEKVDVTDRLRTQEVGDTASAISVYKDVRKTLVDLQRRLAESQNVIMDGRDIASVVLPGADVKIYLTAGTRVRAKRRYDELIEKGIECDFETILNEIEERDWRDMHRENSPLVRVPEATLIDSSEMTIDEVADKVIELVKEEMAKDI